MREGKQTCYGLENPRLKVSSGDDDGTLGAVAHEYFPYPTPYVPLPVGRFDTVDL